MYFTIDKKWPLKSAEQHMRGIIICPKGSYYYDDKNDVVVFTDKLTTRDIAIHQDLFGCDEEVNDA